MKIEAKIINRQSGLRPIAFLCVLLTIMTSHPVIFAAVAQRDVVTTPVSPATVEESVSLEAIVATNTPIVWRFDTSKIISSNLLSVATLQNVVSDLGYVSGVELEDDFSLRFLVWDSNRLDEIRAAMASVDTNIVVTTDGSSLIVTFPEAIAQSLKDAISGQTLSLSKIGGTGPHPNLFWCVVILVGIGVGTYYGMKYLCKQAGLIPTNAPPPPPTNPPPPPPPTNKPPTWTNTNGGPITITGTGGFKMLNLVSESSLMPPEVFAAMMAGTSPNNPLFKTESPDPMDDTLYGIASMNAEDFNVRYGPGYSDPGGGVYIRCMRQSIQFGQTLGTGTTNWQTRMTMYTWINDTYVCFSIYDANNVLRENVVVKRNTYGELPPSITIESFEYVIRHWYNPNAQGFFRTWSGLPPTVP